MYSTVVPAKVVTESSSRQIDVTAAYSCIQTFLCSYSEHTTSETLGLYQLYFAHLMTLVIFNTIDPSR